jgi:hypothetical protein
MKKSKKASDTVIPARAHFEEARIAARKKMMSGVALQKTTRRQFQKTRAKVIQAHTRARGQRNQARRDGR